MSDVASPSSHAEDASTALTLQAPDDVGVLQLSFTDASLEHDYVGFMQKEGLLLPAATTFGCTGVTLLFYFRDVSAAAAPQATTERAVLLAIAIISFVVGLVMVFFRARGGRAASPHATEIWWCVSLILWMVANNASFEPRYFVACASKRFRYVVPNVCEHFIEANQVSGVATFVIGCPRSKFVAALGVICVLLMYALRFAVRVFSWRTTDYYFVLQVALIVVFTHVREYTGRKRFLTYKQLQKRLAQTTAAKQQLNSMLRALFPPSVAERLARDEPVADRRVATVIFSDVAGFTSWSAARSAADVVSMLNDMYNRFDRGLSSFGAEKVTTIGDAYWAACNIPTECEEHARHAVAFACYMHECRAASNAARNVALQIRIGVHTGAVVGLVAGHHQLAYQLFGPTCEGATALEELAPVGGTLVSGATRTEMLRGGTSDSRNEELLSADFAPGPLTASGMATYVLQQFNWRPASAVTWLREMKEGSVSSDSRPASEAERATRATRRIIQRSGTTSAAVHRDSITKPINVLSTPSTQEARAAAAGKDDPSMNDSSQIDADEDLYALRATLEKKRHTVRLTFVDDKLESEYETFALSVFPQRATWVVPCVSILSLALLIGVAAGPTPNQPAAVYVLLAAAVLCAPLVVPGRPYVCYAAYWLQHVFLYAAILSSRPCVVSSSTSYLVLFLALSVCVVGTPWFSWVYGVLMNFPLIDVPSITLDGLRAPDQVTSSFTLFIFHGLLFLVSFYRAETQLRAQFIDMKIAQVADQVMLEQRSQIHQLLSRTVPAFVLPELLLVLERRRNEESDTAQLSSGRSATATLQHRRHRNLMLQDTSCIAHAYPWIIVCFASVAAHRFQVKQDVVLDDADSAGVGSNGESKPNDEAPSMPYATLLSASAMVYDDVLAQPAYANDGGCVKIKTIGDVALIVSGLHLRHPESDDASLEASCGPRSGPRSREAALAHNSPAELLALARSSLDLARDLDKAMLAAVGLHAHVGLHTGPVVAGVLGLDRLMYDVFGDTVNHASRVMSAVGDGGSDAGRESPTTKTTAGGSGGVFVSDDFYADYCALVAFEVEKSNGHNRSPSAFGPPMSRKMKGKGACEVRAMLLEGAPTSSSS